MCRQDESPSVFIALKVGTPAAGSAFKHVRERGTGWRKEGGAGEGKERMQREAGTREQTREKRGLEAEMYRGERQAAWREILEP